MSDMTKPDRNCPACMESEQIIECLEAQIRGMTTRLATITSRMGQMYTREQLDKAIRAARDGDLCCVCAPILCTGICDDKGQSDVSGFKLRRKDGGK